MTKSHELDIEHDGFSIKVIDKKDHLFFVRLNLQESDANQWVFSDFSKISPIRRSHGALELLRSKIRPKNSVSVFIFRDVFPSASERSKAQEAFEAILELIRLDGLLTGYTCESSMLKSRNGKFDAVVKIRPQGQKVNSIVQ